MGKNILLIVSACLLFGLFYWFNTKNHVTKGHYEMRNKDLLNYVEDIYKISAYDFKISSLTHFNDSLFRSINERLRNNDLQLVLYIPQNYCQDCVIRIIDKFKSLPDIMQDKIFIMTSFTRERDVRMWLSSHKYRYPVYNSLSFGMTNFGSKNRMTLFLVDSSGIL